MKNGIKYHLMTVDTRSSTAVTEVTTSNILHQSNSEVNKNISESSDKKPHYSIGKTSDEKLIAVLDKNILDGVDKRDYLETVKNEFAKLGNIYVYGQNITVNKKSFREYTNSKSTIRTKNIITIHMLIK